MLNVNKLKGKVVEKGLNIEKLAYKMKVSKSTLYRKISTLGEHMTIKDIVKIADILELDIKEIMNIFFTF